MFWRNIFFNRKKSKTKVEIFPILGWIWSRIRIRINYFTKRIRIHIKMKRIRNTAFLNTIFFCDFGLFVV